MPTRPPGTPDLDLTLDDTFGTIGGAVFATGQNKAAGTGVFNSFVQLQDKGFEQGYNTDARAQYDEKSSHNHKVPTITTIRFCWPMSRLSSETARMERPKGLHIA